MRRITRAGSTDFRPYRRCPAIEDRDFDAYPVGGLVKEIVPPEIAIQRKWDAIDDKVSDQTNRLVIDLSNTSLTTERSIVDDLSTY